MCASLLARRRVTKAQKKKSDVLHEIIFSLDSYKSLAPRPPRRALCAARAAPAAPRAPATTIFLLLLFFAKKTSYKAKKKLVKPRKVNLTKVAFLCGLEYSFETYLTHGGLSFASARKTYLCVCLRGEKLSLYLETGGRSAAGAAQQAPRHGRRATHAARQTQRGARRAGFEVYGFLGSETYLCVCMCVRLCLCAP